MRAVWYSKLGRLDGELMAKRTTDEQQPWLTLSVANFRSIAELELALPRFAVLVGPNSAGKTNVIDALSALGDVVDRKSARAIRDLNWHDVIRRQAREARELRLGARVQLSAERERGRGVRKAEEDGRPGPEAATVELSFTIRRDSKRDLVGFSHQRVTILRSDGEEVLNVEVDKEDVGTLRSQDPKDVAILRFRSDRQPKEARQEPAADLLPEDAHSLWMVQNQLLGEVRPALQVRRFRLDATSLRSDSLAVVRGRDPLEGTGRGLALAVERLKDKPVFHRVLQALREVYPRIESVIAKRISAGRVTLQIKEQNIAEPLDQANVSDGVLHALALYIALFEPRPGILAIEEPENAIHPWAIRSLLAVAQDSPNCVILTTHSETVVNAIRDPSSLFIVEQGDNGTTVTRATTRESALATILRESGQKLGEVWMDGSLGGVPR